MSAPTLSEPTPAATTTAKPARTTGGGGVKETIESILVAFILAFVFRAFVVEAFVIPTGSMATTLLGAHCRFRCPDCGYSFDLSYNSPTANEDEDVPVPATAGPISVQLYCPNCGFAIPQAQLANPPVDYGDRILVLKYLYLLGEPQRWDVVVFKAPINPNQNFIKRLGGKPGEAIMVLDGDVYVGRPGDPDLTHYVVQPKPPAVQQAMWRLVYDNDYHPSGQDRGGYPWQQPWRSTGPCRSDEAGGRAFTFDAGGTTAGLEYDALANGGQQRFADYLAYDQNTWQYYQDPVTKVFHEGRLLIPRREPYPDRPMPQDVPVSDLDLRLTYQRTAGAGPFTIGLTKRDDLFTAELTPTTATLYHSVGGGGRQRVGQPVPLPPGGRPVRVELSNADYEVRLWVDGRLAARTAKADYAPNIAELLAEYRGERPPPPRPSVTIRADDQQGRASHVSLWRDVYYYNRNSVSQPKQATPDHPQVLGADEYFTMGDNSQVSYDARCWDKGIQLPAEDLDVGAGKVPGRFLLGKAFYVYWPAGHRAASWLPSLVPDFDGMRLIH